MFRNLISVVIPTFNRENTIKYCLESVLNQTFKKFEVIIVDDCSNDNTIEIIKSYRDKRIKLIRLEKRSGAQHARNRGILESKTEWIAFQDSDDKWNIDKLEKQLKLLRLRDFDPYLVIHSNCNVYYCDTGKKGKWTLPKVEGKDVYQTLLTEPSPMLQGMLVSKQSLIDIGLLDENVPSFQEWDTSLRLSKICEFIHIDEALFEYYIYNDGTISSDLKKDFDGYEYIINKYKEDIIVKCGIKYWNSHIHRQIKLLRKLKLESEAIRYKHKFINI